MKRKSSIILMAAIMLPALVSGRVVRRSIGIYPSSVPETTTLRDGGMEFTYDYSYRLDTASTDESDRTSDQMLLQIAPDGLSKFSSLKNLTVDSVIMSSTTEQLAAALSDGKLSKGDYMNIYKNYPESGKVTHTEKICTDWFRYEETIPQIDWTLTDSTRTILDYECRMAETDFRGRHWRAFYTEDIPLMEGPWKLHGLPGLIMEAEADDGDYRFTIIGVKSESHRPITIYKVPFNETSRHKLYDTKYRFDSNPYTYAEATAGITTNVTDDAGNPIPGVYDPIDLTYGYIECDWLDAK